MRYLKDLPSHGQLMLQSEGIPSDSMNVNTHIHTPYSFSSFSGMEQIFGMAVQENIQVLGINDFYVTDGYEEFADLAGKNNIFPLFNIEFIALSKKLQSRDIRVNDPNNPGRTYMCGKGMSFPFVLQNEYADILENVKAESQRQIVEMITKLNNWLEEQEIGISLSYEKVQRDFARQMVRERHVAQALRSAVFEYFGDDAKRLEALQKIYAGKPSDVDIHNAAALENELRNNLLKVGKKAFVQEDEKAFLSVDQVKEIIIRGGGIPCYPVLLDDISGEITEFESDRDRLYRELAGMDIRCIELIPQRNRLEILEPFARFFYEKGFVVTFGTEHNAPGLFPLTPVCRGNVPLTDFLCRINYEGASVYAAHQYLLAQGSEGFLDGNGKARDYQRTDLTLLGNAVIRKWIGGR